MQPRVVLVFDEPEPRPEALQYSMELARRMRCTLVLLMLLPHDAMDGSRRAVGSTVGMQTPSDKLFAPAVEAGREAGLEVEALLKTGDPSSELLKYLAETRPIRTIVWGGRREAVERRDRGRRPHWFVRMRSRVEAPVVVPALKP
jgi:hypothetical protein